MEHDEVYQRITSILDGEDDWVTAMATVVCELHNAFDHYHWTGFYRTTEPNVLKIGPYQGGHGCLVIPFDKGICGAAARTGETQDVPDVHARPEHIACRWVLILPDGMAKKANVYMAVLLPRGFRA